MESELLPGDLYSVRDGKGGFGIVKLLVRESGLVHIRIYKQHFELRPSQVDFANLTLGTIHDTDGFGIGHLPIREAEFYSWDPVMLEHGLVSEVELEGYRF